MHGSRIYEYTACGTCDRRIRQPLKDWEVLKPRLEKSNNGSYWVNKISRNRERDNEVNKRLLFEDWTVIRFWGNEIKKDVEECVKVVEEAVWDVVFGEE